MNLKKLLRNPIINPKKASFIPVFWVGFEVILDYPNAIPIMQQNQPIFLKK